MTKRKRLDGSFWTEEVEEHLLPLHNVMSIVRNALPREPIEILEGSRTALGNTVSKRRKAKIGKCFQSLLQECVSEFIQIISCKLWLKTPRPANVGITFTDEDILHAMESLKLSQYSTTLRLFMNDYRELAYDVFRRRLEETLVEPLGLPPSHNDEFERELLAIMDNNNHRVPRDA